MILESGMLLCWIAFNVTHCGRIVSGDVFLEQPWAFTGDQEVLCGDGTLPLLSRKFSEVSGIYDITCGDKKSPIIKEITAPGAKPQEPKT